MINIYLIIILLVSVVFITGYQLYYQATKFKKCILIKKKYSILKNGIPKFIIVDENDKKYSINTSIFNMKHRDKKIFDAVTEGHLHNIYGYGKFIEKLSLYPIVYKLKPNY